jgi:hypothetical protein
VGEKRLFIEQMKIRLPDLDSDFGRTIDFGEDASLAGNWSQGQVVCEVDVFWDPMQLF